MRRPLAVLPEVECLLDISNQIVGRNRLYVVCQPQTGFVAVIQLRHPLLEALFRPDMGNQRIDGIVIPPDPFVIGFVQGHVPYQKLRSPQLQAIGFVVPVMFEHPFELAPIFTSCRKRQPQLFSVAPARCAQSRSTETQ